VYLPPAYLLQFGHAAAAGALHADGGLEDFQHVAGLEQQVRRRLAHTTLSWSA
jgi:hypothetical protein